MSTPNRTGPFCFADSGPRLRRVAKRVGRRQPRGGGPKTKQFGLVLQFLRKQRGKRASLDALVADLRHIGVQISRSAVYAYERGRVPDVVFLDGLGRLMKVPREQLIEALMADIRGELTRSPEDVGRDLTRHMADVQAALQINGGADVVLSPAEARLLAERHKELEHYARDLEEALLEVGDLAARIFDVSRVASGGTKARPTPSTTPDDRGHD